MPTLDRVAPQGRMDLIADFAFRLPVTVICEMLGIPEEDHEMFFHGARTGGRLLDPVPLSRAEIDEANAGNLAQVGVFPRVCSSCADASRATTSRAQLVQAEEEGSKLSNEELTANIILLFGAGHETTVNLIGNGLLALHRNPDQLRRLQERPLAHRQRRRGVPALRFLGAAHGPGRAGGRRGGRRRTWPRARRCCACSAPPIAIRPSIPIPTGSTSRAPTSARCRSAAASISASAPSSRASRPRSPSPRCCAACRDLTLDDAEHPDWRPTFVLRGLNRLPARW